MKGDRIYKFFKYLPVLLTAVLITLCAVFLANHDFKDILAYTPDSLWLAAFVLLGFFGLKSLSVVFPLAALFVTSGMIYPLYISIPLNVVGLAVCFTVPYLVGRFSGTELLDHLVEKYPKVNRFVEKSHENDLFATYITRAIIVVPGDIASLVFGALRMPYRPYLLGSILGVLPEMLVITYIGGELDSLTPASVAVMAVMIIATLLFTVTLNKRISKRGKQYDRRDFE